MKEISRFHTPPFSEKDRWEFVRALGLGSLEFRYLECIGNRLVRASRINEGMEQPLLDVGEEIPKLTEVSYQVLMQRHPVHVPAVDRFREQSFLEAIFPFPLRLAHRLKQTPSPDDEVSATQALRDELLALTRKIAKLEAYVTQAELCLLWIYGSQTQMPVLFHSVRKKVLRIGTSSYLSDLAKPFTEGTLTTENLREYFGTQVCFLPLDTSEAIPEIQL